MPEPAVYSLVCVIAYRTGIINIKIRFFLVCKQLTGLLQNTG